MPDGDSTMGAPSSSSEGSSMGLGKMMSTSGPSSPTAVIGLLAFGLTAILFGLSQLPKPYGNGFTGYAGVPYTELVFGGLILILAGIISVLRGHNYWGSAFLGFGAFWASWAFTSGSALGYGTAGFMFIWLLFTLTFLISSMKHGWGPFFGLLFLFIAFILLIVVDWQSGAGTKVASGTMWAVGGLWIFTGLIWWLGATATLTNETFGRKIIPM